MTDTLTLPLQVEGVERLPGEKPTHPCTIVILGATGDLTHRKLIPSLLHLAEDDLLPEGVAVLGVGRRSLTDEEFRTGARESLSNSSRWSAFAPRLSYLAADLDSPEGFRTIAARL